MADKMLCTNISSIKSQFSYRSTESL